MEHDSRKKGPFWNLARELIIDILSRLPIPSIFACKNVCKSWLDLVECEEFAKSHESRSVPGLALYRGEPSPSPSKPYEIIDIVDELDPLQNYVPHCNLAFSFSFPHDRLYLHTSVNGLLFLCKRNVQFSSSHKLFICNPLTRQYINISHFLVPYALYIYGFGVSQMSGQYKLMRITHYFLGGSSQCDVYTLGTGLWRRIDARLPHDYFWTSVATFFNGNLHLLRLYDDLGISYLDLETEHFSSFSLPPLEIEHSRRLIKLSALGDCLCLCDYSDYAKTDIWLMKEYGDDKSWVKEYIINKPPLPNDLRLRSDQGFFPVKVLKDGDILFRDKHARLFCFFNKTKTTQTLDGHDNNFLNSSCIYTPTFLDLLKTFAMENVCSF